MPSTVTQEWFDAERYSRGEAARLLGVPAGTIGNWRRGYDYRLRSGRIRHSAPLIVPPSDGRWLSFGNLAEAHTVAAFRSSGVTMQRIRPALQYMMENLGIDRPLASRHFLTDGVELFFRYIKQEAEGELVVLLNLSQKGQVTFEVVIEQYLRRVDWAHNSYAQRLWPAGHEALIVIDPQRGFGRPVIDRRGVRVKDVLDRIRAGEGTESVLRDFGLTPGQLEAARAFAKRVYARAA